jgi:phage baseplate assembly protein W
MDEKLRSFLGRGWRFPPTFDQAFGRTQMVSDEADIKESIWVIMSTMPGERIMQPEFGCDLARLVFENNNSNLEAHISYMVYNALLNFEPRVKDVLAQVIRHAVTEDGIQDDLEGRLHIEISYTIISTNTRHNLVFPFYLNGEGTNVSQ